MNYPIEKFDVYTLNVGYSCNNADWNWKNIQSPFARLYLVLNPNRSLGFICVVRQREIL